MYTVGGSYSVYVLYVRSDSSIGEQGRCAEGTEYRHA